jgi:phosphoribosylformylglycinamidine synthase I
MNCAVVVFPGSNCDRDAAHAWEHVTGGRARLLWHQETDLGDAEAVIVPGGFSYGDYLRAGALARLSPVMRAVGEAAGRGLPVLGVCNGFQVLCESGLLPGALAPNAGRSFRCEVVTLAVEDADTAWTRGLTPGETLRLPIAHGEGRYCIDPARPPRVVLRYAGPNPNGSDEAVAGIANAAGNVVGLMPHPERACEPILGGEDGARLLKAVLHALR